jgi:aspartyl-tRNA(Asn)/glutamyl-tRNA(Gln) amidotransferase subunit C
MSIRKEEVLHVANLARLDVSETQADQLTYEMESIINFADMLAEIDIGDAPPVNRAIRLENVFRADIVTNGDRREEMLANAPQSEAGCYAVPKIIE